MRVILSILVCIVSLSAFAQDGGLVIPPPPPLPKALSIPPEIPSPPDISGLEESFDIIELPEPAAPETVAVKEITIDDDMPPPFIASEMKMEEAMDAVDIPELPTTDTESSDAVDVASEPSFEDADFFDDEGLSDEEKDDELDALLSELNEDDEDIDFDNLTGEELLALDSEDLEEQIIKDEDEEIRADIKTRAEDIIVEIKRKQESYADFNTTILPDTIYKKRYRRTNKHLPLAYNSDDMDKYLFKAALKGHTNGVRAILNMGLDPNIQSKSGSTPLMAAAQSGHLDMFMMMIIRGAEVDTQNNNGLTAMHSAAYSGNFEIVQVLLNLKANPNIQNIYGNTSLMAASINGNTDVARLLMVSGADLDAQNDYGLTAMHLASYSGNSSVVRALLHMKANPSLITRDGATAEEIALSGRHWSVIRALGGEGALEEAERFRELMWDQAAFKNDIPTVRINYEELSPEEKGEWDKMLDGFLHADRNFENITIGEREYWNEKLKSLKIVFRGHFSASSPEEQENLEAYMKKWQELDELKERDTILATIDRTDLPPIEHKETTGKPSKEKELEKLINDWWGVDAKYSKMSSEQKSEANIKREELLDKILFNKIPGEYAHEFAALPQMVKDKFSASMRKWDEADLAVEPPAKETPLTPSKPRKSVNPFAKDGDRIRVMSVIEIKDGKSVQAPASAMGDDEFILEIKPKEVPLPRSQYIGETKMPDLYLQIPRDLDE